MSAASRLSLLVAAALCAAVPALGSPTLTSAHSAGGADERGWAVHVDNDLFAFAGEDRDYTAGVAFTLGGDVARAHTLSLEPLLTWIDRKSGFDRLERGAGVEGRALEFGLTLFTPNDLGARHPIRGDRPYADLLYVSSSKLGQDESGRVAYQSSVTLGVLGLPFAGSLHRAVHDVAGGVEPMGYANQISAGGEPTARYSVARYALLGSGSLGGHPFSERGSTTACCKVSFATAPLRTTPPSSSICSSKHGSALRRRSRGISASAIRSGINRKNSRTVPERTASRGRA